jgi:xylulose-5-phosphate/fructose-6-phosphate phosphoketolase
VEGTWRAHQVPVLDPVTNKKNLKIVEDWMRSYKPGRTIRRQRKLIPELQELAPSGERRISANPHANGGLLRKNSPARLPRLRRKSESARRNLCATHRRARALSCRSDAPQHEFLPRLRPGRDRLQPAHRDLYAASKKTWLAEYKPEDADGGELDVAGRVMEMLSEHTLEGWFEGYVLTGRHGLFSTYEAFVHVIDSMFNQHAKWLEKSKLELDWRAPVPSINILITSLVWRQDHNGFTHQDPGFLDVVTNKSPDVVRIYLPPDANCLLSVTDHCLRSRDYVNVIVADKQDHLQYLTMDEAVDALHQGHRHLGLGFHRRWRRTRCRDGLRRRYRDHGVARRGRRF